MRAQNETKFVRPPARDYDLVTFPQLNKGGEAVRQKIGQYLDYMAKCGKPKPGHIDLFPDQYKTLASAVNQVIDRVAPPLAHLTIDGIPVRVLGRPTDGR